MTVFEFQAKRIDTISQALAQFVSTTPADRLDWHAAVDEKSQTRSVYEQIHECASFNSYIAALVRGETPDKPQDMPPAYGSSEEAQADIRASGEALAEAVRALDEGALERKFPHWRGPLPGEMLLEAPYRNMAYHAGQINFIQLLLGDTEFHAPARWRTPDENV